MLKIIRFGLRFELTAPPPLRRRGPTFRGTPAQKRSLLATLEEWLERGVIEPDASPTTLQSLLFPVPKPGNRWRWVLDSKLLNQHLHRRQFRMETVSSIRSMLRKGDWLASIDLRDAFLHVPIHRRHRRYLAFRALGRQYRFAAMSFGTSVAPRVFTMLLRPVLAQLHREGIRVSAYLDDLLIAASTEAECLTAVSRVRALLTQLGFLINLEKSQLTPTQRLTHLGLVWDTLTFRLFLPKDKWHAIQRDARRLLRDHKQHGVVSIRRLAGVAGKLVAASPALLEAAYHRHSLHRCVSFGLRRSHGNWEATSTVSRTALRDLRWVTSRSVRHMNGAPITPSSPAAVLTTDASTTGWGAVLNIGTHQYRTLGFFSPEESARSSNWREATGICRAFFAFRRRIQRLPSLLVQTDNTTSCSILHRFGSRWKHLGEALDPMLRAIIRWRVDLTAQHLAGTDNVAADTLSRATRPLRNEWSLSWQAYRRILDSFPAPSIDYFASHLTTKCRRFVSRHPDPKAMTVDAFGLEWSLEFGLFVPPINLIPRVLSRLVTQRAHGIVVVPDWPSRPWYGLLMSMAVAQPLSLGPDAMVPVPGHHPLKDGRNPPLLAVWV